MSADEEGGRRKRERRRADDDISLGWLRDMVQTNDDKHEDAHGRLRRDIRSMEHRLTALETAKVSTELHLQRLDSTPPPDVLKLRWDTRTVLGLAVAFASLAVGQIALNSKLETNMSAKMDQYAKVQEERIGSLQRALNELKNRFELSQIEQSTFNKDLLRDRAEGRRGR